MSCKFINSLFLRNLLESKFNNTDVVIRKHHIQSVSGNVHRLSLRYTSAQQIAETTLDLVVLVKPEPYEEESEHKEWLLLKDVLPRFADIAKDVSRPIQFAPKIILSCSEPKEALFLENWQSNGFVRSAYEDGLSLNESKVAIEQLATFHATSVAFFAKHPQQQQSFRAPSLLDEIAGSRNFFREALGHFVDNAPSMKIPGSVVQKLKALQPRLLAKSAEDFAAPLNGGFVVLNIGNATAQNILFKYRNGKPEQALQINFGNVFCGSPIVDLMFFITTSVSYNVSRHYKDELIYTYHSKLSESLVALKYMGNMPTLVDFHLEFLKRGIFELMLTLTVVPYLRSAGCNAQPKLVRPFINDSDMDLGVIAKRVLATHAEDIIEELDVVECNGLLDWGVESSHLKKLLRNFQ